ncbi:unnamed protein product [Rotaria sp. Silwood2]|nr:unnamed protein product [Rotaria sp. Silwood2]CAF2808612.1 unnamed protein product [Rotaria sp. Silwood2]CAF2899767.1 unnamed protein product [Rotaria sp. Silwood2]CAF2968884.1 unnamed protein product [Rotaria sp. Silwood2]CAF3947785.1 unnamed protein product [Rotaria sp. Silwood2]
MALSVRTRLVRPQKQEHETRVIVNLCNDDKNQSNCCHAAQISESTKSVATSISANNFQPQSRRAFECDYEAPLTAYSLKPYSKWLIVRRNLHRIRFMSYNDHGEQNKLPDFYLGLQMIRELKRAQDEIQRIDQETNFHAVKQFVLAIDDKHAKTYDTRHIKPTDALIYDRLGDEPMAVQNLLYYFSQQNVSPGTVFWDFLNEVNHVLNMNRKRTVLVERLRKFALILAFISYGLIGIMFFLMIISVITTALKVNDPEVQWMSNGDDQYSMDMSMSI